MLNDLLRLLKLLLRRLFGPRGASPVLHFTIEVNAMKNARFTWTRPTTRMQGGPLDPADIVGTEISLRVAGIQQWTVLGVAPGAAQEFTQDDLNHGDYEARAIVITDTDVRGAAAVLPFRVADDSPAAAVGALAVALS